MWKLNCIGRMTSSIWRSLRKSCEKFERKPKIHKVIEVMEIQAPTREKRMRQMVWIHQRTQCQWLGLVYKPETRKLILGLPPYRRWHA